MQLGSFLKFNHFILPMKVQAAIGYEPSQDPQIKELDLRDPLPDEVLVKVVASGFCKSDIENYRLYNKLWPIVMGHELGGIVVKVGNEVTSMKVGDHVISIQGFCQQCEACKRNELWHCEKAFDYWHGVQIDRSSPLSLNGQEVNCFATIASFATHCVIKSRQLVVVDKDIDLRHVCIMGCGPITGTGTVLNYFSAQQGQSILISGLGPVGLEAVIGAKLAGCKNIVVIDHHPEKLQMASKLGATLLINTNEQDLSVLDGIPFDFAADTTGSKDLCTEIDNHIPSNAKRCDVTADGFWPFMTVGQSVSTEFIPKLVKLYQEGKYPIDSFLSYYRFSDLPQIYEDMKNKKVIKPVIVFE